MKFLKSMFHVHIWKKVGPNAYTCRRKGCTSTGRR